MNAKRFGPNLKKVLENIGMNQTELAKRTGLTQAAISQIISGERNPTLYSVCKIMTVIPFTFEKIMEEAKR